jgi:hypothetical protein
VIRADIGSVVQELGRVKQEVGKQLEANTKEIQEKLNHPLKETQNQLQVQLEENKGKIESNERRITEMKKMTEENQGRLWERTTTLEQQIEKEAVEVSRRQGKGDGGFEPQTEQGEPEMTKETNNCSVGIAILDNVQGVVAEVNSKPRKRREKSLAAAGACRKKKFKLSKKKLEVLKKTPEEKSAEKAFEERLDQMWKERNERINMMLKILKERFQHQVLWDPGGLIYENRPSDIPFKSDSRRFSRNCYYKDPVRGYSQKAAEVCGQYSRNCRQDR